MKQPTKTPTKINTKKKFNYTKWGFILGISIPLTAVLVSITVPEIRCSLGLEKESCTVQKEIVEIITQTETGEPLGGVKIQFISQGAPEIQYTDNNGFARVKIPNKGDVSLNFTKKGFPPQNFTIDLDKEQSKTRIVRFQKTGTPKITELSPGASPSPIPSPESKTNLPLNSTNKSTPLWKTNCGSATTGLNLKYILKTSTGNYVTFGREMFPLVAYIGRYYDTISVREPIEFVCNLNSNYKNLNFAFGVHSANRYALPKNKLLFQVFLDGKLAESKQVIAGKKQELNLNLQDVNNVSLRVECISEYKCPALSFSEMSLQ